MHGRNVLMVKTGIPKHLSCHKPEAPCSSVGTNIQYKYASDVWDPYYVGVIMELEKVQRRAAC